MNPSPEELLALALAAVVGPLVTQGMKQWPWVKAWATVVNAVLGLICAVAVYLLWGMGDLDTLTRLLGMALGGGQLGAVAYTAVHRRNRARERERTLAELSRRPSDNGKVPSGGGARGNNSTRLLLLAVALIGFGGCSLGNLVAGPNRMMKMLGGGAVSDFATFEGSCTAPCRDVYAQIAGLEGPGGIPGTVVGCILGVTPVGGTERTVFFPLGELRDRAREVPVQARISVNGRPLGNVAYVADGMRWLGE